MELEEMRTLWQEMSAGIAKQKQITDTLIIKMTQAGYRSKLNKIVVPEAISSLLCFGFISYILINFHKLNTWYLQACGIVVLAILIGLPIMSIRALRTILAVNIAGNSYKDALAAYSKGKLQFMFVQKLSFYLGAVLIVVCLPVMGMLIGGKDIFMVIRLWFAYAIAFPFYYWFARWVFKCYAKITADAEDILKDLDVEG